LVIWLFLAACSGPAALERGGEAGPEAVRPETAAAVESPAPTLELRLSGGIAGRDERLSLTDDGRALVLDQRSNRSREVRLSPARQEKIVELLAALENVAADTGFFSASRCRDCLVYVLILPTDGKPRRVRIVSDRLADSPYQELISTLIALMAEAAGDKE
jgi:hypothetical protein